MSDRGSKKIFGDSRTTLDNLHQLQIQDLHREKESIGDLDKRIKILKQEISETSDVIVKNQKEEQLFRLQKQRDDWKSNTPVYDYFFETGEILYNYYDLQDKIQKGGGSSGKVMKAKPGSVLAALMEESDQQEQKEETQEPKEEGREALLHKYLRKVDPEKAKETVSSHEDPNGICDECESEMVFSANEALFYCNNCGHQEFVLIDSDKPSYKDPPREITYYAYKRINHFNELLAQFQAKESTEISEEVFQAIVEELKKERVTASMINKKKIREILKKLKLSSFYEHDTYIMSRIIGKTAPVMPREVEEKLRYMFREIQGSFSKHCPSNRNNFLSYHYVLYKFCELLELDEYLSCFSLLKNRDKLYLQDKIWQKICLDMSWEFIRTI